MRRCTALRPSSFGASSPHQAKRWHSYDKAALTKEALLQKVEAGLGRDADGKPLKIDAEAKTISTAVGNLPISPIFDPAWMQARRKVAKAAPGPPLGRFRRKLANNPFAQALATPIRKCPNSAISLPRYFLQDFELVQHPTTGKPWWAPGPLSFEHVQPTKRLDEEQPDISKGLNEEALTRKPESAPVALRKDGTADSEKDARRPRRAPITSYTLNRKSLVDMIGGKNKKYLSVLLAVRTGMAVTPDSREAVWREDMGEVLLQKMRQQATDALVLRGNRLQPHEDKHRFIEPCASWKDVEGVKLRGCVLWLPEKRDAARQYATLDIEGAQYGKKMVVHNLWWLLGEQEVQRLRESAELFREGEIFVLKQWGSTSMMRLHMLLWRLQGYLAEPAQRLSIKTTMRGAAANNNPELIQPEDWARPDKPALNTPVFLIHDGGGTTFAYHCLEVLGRYVYGIHNPCFYSGDVFDGGLPDMGRLYARWIRQTVLDDGFPARARNHDGTVSVLLGGWSLGGLLSLEVARQLADDAVVRVTGILMIDSIYPGNEEDASSSDEAPASTVVESGLTQNQIRSKRCMAEAVRMIRDWRLPEWPGSLYDRRPRVVLLRAKEYVPTKDGRIVGLDLNREDEMLGWGDYDDDMFCDVMDVEGHHFDIFAFERIDGITRAIKKGLDRLEECSQMMMYGAW
ncbi:uncharacterized protein TRIREDRAFT_80312 [Trichoderma reesei QM6a]|uniref:Predicted protein n=2 Tax=Hypocrea jecorina TaxID=51453 RepID=G0RQS1_HYPJQ|nr:uncharacterized protein TRIREDRAFT_80312 [Trichoderma reesei QM6a]EGR46308.1 predicted protein [Trichoderma reesei QM6a]ETR99605.1 hypothetical protein M419DRAFT_102280 [Trichoderma reesei RUT C-30]